MGGITPQGRGRYPGHDVLAQAGHWDELTRKVIFERVGDPPPIRFFTAPEARTLGILCDLAMAQDREPRIPLLAMIDKKMYEGKLDGFQHDDMPDDRETWRLVAAGLDAAARQHGAATLEEASHETRIAIVDAFSKGELHGEVWDELPCAKAWSVVMRAILSEFYSHPWAWNEIGFGGPAYPRGYVRLGAGQRDDWEAPPDSDADPVAEHTPPAR